MYEYLDHVLGTYFSDAAGLSDEEAISTLKEHLANSPVLRQGLTDEIIRAFADSTFSWKNILIAHNCVYVAREEDACRYARKIFWETIFRSK